MPATATKKPGNTSPAQALAELDHQLRAQAADDWRRWAVQIADGKPAPDGRQLLTAAAALGITDPAAALHADAEAITAVRNATRTAADCEATAADLLAPYGGNHQKLLLAIATAKAEAERLETIYRQTCDGCGAAYYRSVVHMAHAKHTRIWPDYMATGTAETL